MNARRVFRIRLGIRQADRRGYSLLEVILAIAILTGAIAVLGELLRMALRNAEVARDVTHAQFLCECVLAEITSGALPTVAVADVDCGAETDWRYSVQLFPTPYPNLIAVEVAVYRPDPNRVSSRFELIRWIQDPGVEFSTFEQFGDAQSAGPDSLTAR